MGAASGTTHVLLWCLGQECGPSLAGSAEASLDNLQNWPALSADPTQLICPLLVGLLVNHQY